MMIDAETKHYEFWIKVIEQLHSEKTARTEFMACVIGDWLWDINPGSIGLEAEEISKTWGGVGKYHEWLLKTMDQKKKVLEQMGKYFDNHKSEIMDRLDGKDITYISGFSTEIYYEKLAGTVLEEKEILGE